MKNDGLQEPEGFPGTGRPCAAAITSVTTVTVSDQKKITGYNDTLPSITYSHDGGWHTIVFVTSHKSLPSMSTCNLCALKDINLELFEVLPCSEQLVFPLFDSLLTQDNF